MLTIWLPHPTYPMQVEKEDRICKMVKVSWTPAILMKLFQNLSKELFSNIIVPNSHMPSLFFKVRCKTYFYIVKPKIKIL